MYHEYKRSGNSRSTNGSIISFFHIECRQDTVIDLRESQYGNTINHSTLVCQLILSNSGGARGGGLTQCYIVQISVVQVFLAKLSLLACVSASSDLRLQELNKFLKP